MKQEHIDFLETNKINFDTVKLGYTRNIPIQDLQMYEHIYHQYLNPSYVLTYWCGDCVFDMLKRLLYYYEGLPKAEPETLTVTVPVSEELYHLAVEASKPVFVSDEIPKEKKPKAKKK
jgi:hypothetical protein